MEGLFGGNSCCGLIVALALGFATSCKVANPASVQTRNDKSTLTSVLANKSLKLTDLPPSAKQHWNIYAEREGDTAKVLWYHDNVEVMDQGINQGFILYRSTVRIGDSILEQSAGVEVARIKPKKKSVSLHYPTGTASAVAMHGGLNNSPALPKPTEFRHLFSQFSAFKACNLGISEFRPQGDTVYLYTLYLKSSVPKLIGSAVLNSR
jgi:hypothetical protein